ncbi:P antigen family member 4 [Microcebus murinus]|uniref:P antigen family member 4 n=1 Tax=Microcebus murinus TaxID=30608 RepID=UPI000643C57C|nr:P antigen family member 4 [Microcebus murinus]
MSRRVRSKSRGRGDGQESSTLVDTVAVRKPSGNEEEPPTESQEIEPGQEGGEGVPVVDSEEGELELEGGPPEMVLEKTGGERGDGPDVKAKTPPPTPE